MLSSHKKRSDMALLDNIFIGREDEFQRIKKEYDQLLKGNTGLIFVSGAPGVGKTFLLEHALAKLSRKTLIQVKCRINEERSLTPVIEMVELITDHLLTLPGDTLKEAASEIEKSIGDLSLLMAACHKLSKLLGERDHPNISDFSRVKYRLKNAVCKLIDISSHSLSPLVIHIDDLQWADSLSLEIVKTFLGRNKALNILLVLSFRDNEMNTDLRKLIETAKPLVSHVGLNPLDSLEVKELLFRVFKDDEVTERLASLVYGLTLGNPFYIKEAILKLIGDGIVAFSDKDEKWTISKADGVLRFALHGDVESIIREKIFKPENYNLLRLLSCLDGKAPLEMVQRLSDMEEEPFDALLKKLIASAVLIKYKEADGGTSVAFAHDIIYTLIDTSISGERRGELHYEIANKLLNDPVDGRGSSPEAIVSHLIRSPRQTISHEADKWLKVLFEAGIKEKSLGSLNAALEIFELCSEMFCFANYWDERFAVKLQLELAECLCLCKREEEALSMMDALIKGHTDDDMTLTIKIKQLYLYHYQRDHARTLKTGTEILKKLNFSFGRYQLPTDLIKSRLVYSTKKIRNLSAAPKNIDERIRIILDTLTIMNACAAVSDDTLTAAIGLKAALVSAKYGESANSLVGYISYAYVLYMVWHDLKRTKLLVDHVIDMCGRIDNHSTKSMVYFMIGSFLSYWFGPMAEADRFLQKSIEYGEMTGDFLFLGYSIMTSMDTKLMMGMRMDDMLAFIADCRSKYAETEQYATTYNLEVHAAHIRALKHGCNDYEFDQISRSYPKLTAFEKLTEQTLLLERLLLHDEAERGYELVKTIAPYIQSANGLICKISIVFYSLLIRVAINHRLGRAEQRVNRQQMRQLLKELEAAAGMNPHNFQGFCMLAKTEYENYIRGHATDQYHEAAELAHRQGNIRLEALADLLAAKRYRGNAKMREFYAAESVKAFRVLGADDVADRVSVRYGLDMEPDDKALRQTEDGGQTGLLLYDFIQKSNSLDEEGRIALLLSTVLEAGADYCTMIFEKSSRFFLRFQQDKSGTVNSFYNDVNINNLTYLPHKAIRYAARTETTVVLRPGEYDAKFATDAYIADNPDAVMVCLPVMNCGVLVGVLYFESRENPVRDSMIFEIRSLLPAFVSSLTSIRDVDIKKLFAPVKTQSLLTDREMDIMDLLAKGLSNEQIGGTLRLSVGTIKKHVSAIMTKLDADNRTQALIKAREMKII